MGKRLPPQLLPLVRTVSLKLGRRGVYYKRRGGLIKLVFGGLEYGFISEQIEPKQFTNRFVGHWTADLIDFIDRARVHPKNKRYEAEGR